MFDDLTDLLDNLGDLTLPQKLFAFICFLAGAKCFQVCASPYYSDGNGERPRGDNLSNNEDTSSGDVYHNAVV